MKLIVYALLLSGVIHSINAGNRLSDRVLERHARLKKLGHRRYEHWSLKERQASFKYLTNSTQRTLAPL